MSVDIKSIIVSREEELISKFLPESCEFYEDGISRDYNYYIGNERMFFDIKKYEDLGYRTKEVSDWIYLLKWKLKKIQIELK